MGDYSRGKQESINGCSKDIVGIISSHAAGEASVSKEAKLAVLGKHVVRLDMCVRGMHALPSRDAIADPWERKAGVHTT